MPVMGLEPIRCCHQQILSLPRLPIPTHRLVVKPTNVSIIGIRNFVKIFFEKMKNNFGIILHIDVFVNQTE